MLEIGNGHMTDTEYRTHMSLWSMLAAPLIAGNDVRNMSPSIIDILTNREVIAIDQDKAGQQGKPIWQSGQREIWTRELAGGDTAVAVFNRAPADAKVTFRWADAESSGLLHAFAICGATPEKKETGQSIQPKFRSWCRPVARTLKSGWWTIWLPADSVPETLRHALRL
jgi:hypothetical protein